METKTVTVLLVEDDEIDSEAVVRAFRKQKIANPINIVSDGLHALDALRGTNGAEKVERPFVILLDLNMPRMGGIEFLQELRKDPDLHDSLVFVLTTSSADRDKISAYEQHIAGYLVKSNIGQDFVNLVTMMDHYWRYVELPPDRN